MSDGSRPISIGPTSVSNAVFVAGDTPCPKASPQPVTPSSVSSRSSRMFSPAAGLPAIDCSPPLVRYGTVSRINSAAVIFMC